MKIKFVQGHKVQQSDGKGPIYEAGQVYDFDGFVLESYAQKYVNRGYAIEYIEPAMVAPADVKPNFSAPEEPSAVAEPVTLDKEDVKFGFRRGPGRPRRSE